VPLPMMLPPLASGNALDRHPESLLAALRWNLPTRIALRKTAPATSPETIAVFL